MLEAYREHVAERAAQNIPPKPLSAEQVAGLVELLKNPPAGEEANGNGEGNGHADVAGPSTPPAPTALQIVESELPDIETVEFEDMSISEDTEIDAIVPPKKETPPPPPPPPPAPEVNTKEIFKIVEEQPTFKGCETIGDKMERKACADAALMKFIYDNITYPSTARENNVSGTVVVQFVVETDGSVSNVSLIRDIGAGCGQEAMRVVKMMPQWNPGKQRGRAVRVMFTLPVKFKLA